MIKKLSFPPNQLDKKLKASHRFLLILNKLSQQFQFRKLSQSFGRLPFLRKKDTGKFAIFQSLKKRIIQQTFFTLKSYHKSIPQKDKYNQNLRRLFFTALIRFFHQKQRKNCRFAFQKLKTHQTTHNSLKISIFTSIITSFTNRFQKRVFFTEAMTKLKKIHSNQKRLKTFFASLNSYFQRAKKSTLEQSFDLVLKESFKKTHLDDIKSKQEIIIAAKNLNLSKQEQNRLLRTEISALTKTLQLQQASKTKSRKEDYDRNLILQAKNTQKERTNQEFKKVSFENGSLTHELNKKQGYLKLQEESKINSENAEIMFRKIYDYVKSEKTKQSLSLKEVSIFMNRENIDLNQVLKKLGLSKESVLNENIDLKNIQNLYEKQLPGYGLNVNIKESETYRKTMEENVNLREFLQVLLIKILSVQQKQINSDKEELNRLVQGYQSSQKGSKLTLTTLSSSTNRFSR